jgi:hypothetical protein
MTSFARFDSGDGVAGVDRPGEAALALDRNDVGHLHHVEQRGDARGDVLAGRGGGREEGVVMAHQVGHQRRDVLGQLVLVGGVVGQVDLADPGDLRRLLGHSAAAAAGDEQVHLAQLQGCGDGRQRRLLHVLVVVFDEYEGLHHATPRALSLATSSSTLATLTPAWRTGGSVTWVTLSRGAVSTP